MTIKRMSNQDEEEKRWEEVKMKERRERGMFRGGKKQEKMRATQKSKIQMIGMKYMKEKEILTFGIVIVTNEIKNI